MGETGLWSQEMDSKKSRSWATKTCDGSNTAFCHTVSLGFCGLLLELFWIVVSVWTKQGKKGTKAFYLNYIIRGSITTDTVQLWRLQTTVA